MKCYIHKLGCPKNDVDADYISAQLISDGHELVSLPEDADAIVINTCGFIQPAKEESIDEILRLLQLKAADGCPKVFVAGCLAQRYGDQLLEEMPEVDGIFGLGEIQALVSQLGDVPGESRLVRTPASTLDYLAGKTRYVSQDVPYAYLKISDGCNRHCSYCAIPSIRGCYRSRTVDALVREAEQLAQMGIKELILVSQEATRYGTDLLPPATLIELLERLERVTGIEWIRLLYLHPAELTQALIEHVATSEKTLSYFDLPLQHINDDILRAMNRHVDRDTIEGLISQIREICPDAVLRTTLIVGFPGETEAHFEELCQFVEQTEFDRLGCFTYWSEEGTKAGDLPDSVPSEEKSRRMDVLMNLQQQIAFDRNITLIGHDLEVIIDSEMDESTAKGRSVGDCPEIDQEVFVEGSGLKMGDIVRVRVTATHGYDLTAELV